MQLEQLMKEVLIKQWWKYACKYIIPLIWLLYYPDLTAITLSALKIEIGIRLVFNAGRASSIEARTVTSPWEHLNEVSSSKEPVADTTSIVLMFHKEAAYIPPLHRPLCGFWWCRYNITAITPTDLSSNRDVLMAVENAMFNYFKKTGIYRSPRVFHFFTSRQ